MKVATLAGVMALAMLAAPLFADEQRAAADADSEQALVILLDQQPLLVRLRVFVDGRPFRATHREAWDLYVKHLFEQVDRNGDGKLTADEAARTPSPQISVPVAPNATQPPPVHVAFNFRAYDADGDGQVTAEELASFYRRFNGGPLQVGTTVSPVSNLSGFGDALFQRLDLDKNGKLSREELSEGAAALAKLDQDGDELLTPQEVSTRVSTNPARMPATTPVRASPVFVVMPNELTRLGQRLLAHLEIRTKGGDEPQAKLPAPLMERLDVNKDGALDAKELENFAQRPADVEVHIRLGRRKGDEQLITIVTPNDALIPSPPVEVSKDGTILFPFDRARLEMRINGSGPAPSPKAKDMLLQQFKEADADGDGALDRRESQQNNFFPRLFTLLDRNGDDRLEEKELIDYLEKVEEPQVRTVTSTIAIMISGEGSGLFDLADRNRDGRLSIREIRSLPQLISRCDLDHDGALARDEIPKSVHLALGRYQASFDALPPAPQNPPNLSLLRLESSGDGLDWFRKMDRNGDGDVSPREFLGSREDFQKLDTDGDGLISVDEARKAEPPAGADGAR